MEVKVGDILEFKGTNYPDMRVVAVIDNAVAVERLDDVMEKLDWYSKDYIATLLQHDWELK